MLFYTLFIGLETILLGEFKIHNKKIPVIAGIALLVLVSILRFDVGFDYATYYNILYPRLDTLEYERLEPLSKLFFHISHICGYPPLVFVLYACFTYFFIISALKQNSNNFSISIIVYLSLFYLQSFGIIRQALSVAIVFWGFKYVMKKKIFHYLCICVFACMFHKSALVAICIYPLYNNFSFKHIVIFLSVIYISFESLANMWLDSDLFYRGYIEYAEEFADAGGNKMKYFYLLFVVFLLFVAKVYRINYNRKMLNIITLGVFFPFLFGGHLGGRVAEYFNIYLCVFIPQIVNTFNIKIRTLFIGLILMVFLFTIYISDTSHNRRKPFTPYRCVLFQDLNNPKLNVM